MPNRGDDTQYFAQAEMLLATDQLVTPDDAIIKDRNGVLHIHASAIGTDTIEVEQRLPDGTWDAVDTIAQRTQDGITLTSYSGTMPVSSNYEYRVKVAAVGPQVTYGIQFDGS